MTGLSTPSFQTCVDNLQLIHTMLSRHVPEGTLEPFLPSEFLTHTCIDVSTRYFTSRREDPTGTAISFSPAVDPKGMLRSLSTEDHFHGVDNQVLYYALVASSKTKQHQCVSQYRYSYLSLITWIHRFVTTDPITFRTGDIVEVQTTISVVPVKKDRFRMIVSLRALAMLDNGPSMVSVTTVMDAMDAEDFSTPSNRKRTTIDPRPPSHRHQRSKCL